MSTPNEHDIGSIGVVWVPGWSAPYEGGLTLAMKIAWANALDGMKTSIIISGRPLTASYNQITHNRSFLHTGWANSDNHQSFETFGTLVSNSGVAQYVGSWGRMIASDLNFRYCPECMQSGYQSVLFQIDALRVCPLHEVELLTICRRCRISTPRYALTGELITHLFSCPNCGATYADGLDPHRWKDPCFHSAIERRLEPIVDFLQRRLHSRKMWPHWDSWRGPWLNAEEARQKRIDSFHVLSAPPEAGFARLFSDPQRTSVLVTRSAVSPFRRCSVRRRPLEPQSIYAIYKSIRRHLVKSLPKHVKRKLVFSPTDNDLRLRNETLLLRREKCPFLQTIWLWRLRFEPVWSILGMHEHAPRSLFIRDTQNWPIDFDPGQEAWAQHLVAVYYALMEIVLTWYSKVELLSTLLEGTERRTRQTEANVEFLQMVDQYRHPLTPYVSATVEQTAIYPPDEVVTVVGPQPCHALLQSYCKHHLAHEKSRARVLHQLDDRNMLPSGEL